MQENYARALHFVLLWEGGYSDVPGDSGGPTNFGITQREYDVHRLANNEAVQPVRDITTEEVAHIYQNTYWNGVHGDQLPGPLDTICFDTGVNMGVGTAIMLLKQAEGRPISAELDPDTLAALAVKTEAQCHEIGVALCNLREARYRAIADEHDNDNQFLAGWLHRLSALRELAGCTS